jgi:UrcA family protein
MTRTLIAALALTASVFAVGAPSFAAAAEGPRIAVKMGDLDLSTADGRRVAHERIEAVATQACSAVITGSRMAQQDRACHDEIVARFTAQLNKSQAMAKASSPVENAGIASQPKAIDQAPVR